MVEKGVIYIKRIILLTVIIVFCLSNIVSAEISKTFDQFEGRITVESTQTAALNNSLDVKVIVTKSFFSKNGFKDDRVSLIVIEMISKSPLNAPPIMGEFYWMRPGEPYGHTEKFTKSPASSIRTATISSDFKKAIAGNETIMIKIPLLIGNAQYFNVTPEVLREWNEVITFDAIKNPPKPEQ